MADMVIVAYRPKPGCEAALADHLADHVPFLRSLGLATDRPAGLMRAAIGRFHNARATAGADRKAMRLLARTSSGCVVFR